MSSCRTCVHWQRHYPNDGGVCWAQSRPNFTGAQTTAGTVQGRDAIGSTLADITQPDMPVTRYNSTCDNEKEKVAG